VNVLLAPPSAEVVVAASMSDGGETALLEVQTRCRHSVREGTPPRTEYDEFPDEVRDLLPRGGASAPLTRSWH